MAYYVVDVLMYRFLLADPDPGDRRLSAGGSRVGTWSGRAQVPRL